MKLKSFIRSGFVTFVSCILFICVTYAAPISNYEISVTQPDGSILQLLVSGDEFFNYLHDAEGNLIMRSPETGYYVYAGLDAQGKLAATYDVVLSANLPAGSGINSASSRASYKYAGVKVDDIDFDINSNLIRTLEEPAKPVTRSRVSAAHAPAQSNAVGITRENPLQGTMENIIVMICFSDESDAISDAIKSRIDSSFNGTAAPSLNDYIEALSEGEFEINSTLVGQSNDTVLMYKDSHPRAYYQPYNAVTNPDGYQGDPTGSHERTEREHTLLKNAIESISGSTILDGKKLDNILENYVDNVTFIVSGDADGWNELLWPHRWSLYSKVVKLNGKQVWDYNFLLADYTFPATGRDNRSVIIHETMHVLSFPDLYRYSDKGDPVGAWDIMASDDSDFPQFPNSHSRLRYSGWGSPLTEITESGTYTLSPLGSGTGVTAYAIPIEGKPAEFVLLEYRSKNNPTDYDKLFGHWKEYHDNPPSYAWYNEGLVITRINTSVEGNGNSDYGSGGWSDEVYVYRPDEAGFNLADGDIGGAALPDADGYTAFGKIPPNADDGEYAGIIYTYDEGNTGFAVSDVVIAGGKLTFKVNPNQMVPVTDITGVPASASAGVPLQITGVAVPADAWYKDIKWSVSDPGTTGATLNSSNMLNTLASGVAELTAVIPNGLKTGSYTKTFRVSVASETGAVITVDPPEIRLARGETYQAFTAAVEGGNLTDEDVEWSVMGGTSPDTVIELIEWGEGGAVTTGAALIIGMDETADRLLVVAASKEDSTAKGSAAVILYDKFNLTVTAGTGGSVVTGESGRYAQGETVALTASPSSGYRFRNWTADAGSFSNPNSLSAVFTMPAQNAAITANFEYISTGVTPPYVSPPSETSNNNTEPPAPVIDIWKSVQANDIRLADKGGIVTVSGHAKVPAYILDSIKEKDITLVLLMKDYVWTIDGSTVQDIPAGVKEYNLAVKMIKDKNLSELAKGRDAAQFELAHNGPFPFKAALEVVVGSGYKQSLISLYYYNEKSKTLEYRKTEYTDKKGHIAFVFTSASKYVLTTGLSKHLRFNIGNNSYAKNGMGLVSDVAPYISNDSRTMVPLRTIAEALGAEVKWEAETQTVYIIKDGVELSLTVNKALPNSMGTPVILRDRTFIPLRYVAELLGAVVEWDEITRAIEIYQ